MGPNCSVDPLGYAGPGAPVPPSGGQEGIKKALGFRCLGRHMVMPPQTAVEGQAQVLSGETVGYRLAGYG